MRNTPQVVKPKATVGRAADRTVDKRAGRSEARYSQLLRLQSSRGNQAVGRILRSGAVPSLHRSTESGSIRRLWRSITTAAAGTADFIQRMCCGGPEYDHQAPCNECKKEKEQEIRPKLIVNHPGDAYEREADQMAEAVNSDGLRSGTVRRMLDATSSGVQAKNSGCAIAGSEAPASVHQALAAPGQAMDTSVRSTMEEKFGADFGGVRVHTDLRANDSARDIGALAYTLGRNVVFGAGQYSPTTRSGQKLIAHELTHFVQQTAVQRTNHTLEKAALRVQAQFSVAGPSVQGEAELDEQPAQAEEVERVPEVIDDPEADVMDGDSPAGATIAVPAELESATNVEFPSPSSESPLGLQAQEDKSPAKKDKKPDPPPSITKIDIALGSQDMTLTWSDGRPPEKHVISSGRGCPNTKDDPCPTGNEPYCTPQVSGVHPGFKGDGKFKNSEGSAMHWYVEFVSSRGIGIHNSQTATGHPLSHGCVRTGKGQAAETLAEKINAHVTTQTSINVSGKAPTSPYPMDEKHMHSYKGCPSPPKKETPKKSRKSK